MTRTSISPEVAEAALDLADFCIYASLHERWSLGHHYVVDEEMPTQWGVAELYSHYLAAYRAAREGSREGAGTPDTDTGSGGDPGDADGVHDPRAPEPLLEPEVAAASCGGRPGKPGYIEEYSPGPRITRGHYCEGCPNCRLCERCEGSPLVPIGIHKDASRCSPKGDPPRENCRRAHVHQPCPDCEGGSDATQ